jgi:hypothetical protein
MTLMRWIAGLFRGREPVGSICECPWCAAWSPLRQWVETRSEPGLSEIECPRCGATSFRDLDAPVPIRLHGLAILPRETPHADA